MTEMLLADAPGIARAAALLRHGKLVAFGTETVYGLGADGTNGHAVAGIFAAKGRPHFNPLICHFARASDAFEHVAQTALAERLAHAFWPGPLTMVLPKRVSSKIDLLAGAGLDSLAVRVPGHPQALALLRETGCPVAAPSANRSGGVSPTSADHVLADLGGRIAAILDCGPSALGLESSVVDLSGAAPVLLRPGGIPIDALEACIGPIGRTITPSQAQASRTLRSPGLLISHYAPLLPVRLDAAHARPGEALLGFGAMPEGAALAWNLSPGGDLTEAASRLFAGLRWLDEEGAHLGLTGIAAMDVPRHGLGAAINDRLSRAAAPRG